MSLLQNLAAESDWRTTASDERWWERIEGNYAVIDESFHWALEEAGIAPHSSDQYETIYAVRFQMAICPVCGGRGKYVNPSIDAHGLTSEDFDEDPDFAESYFRGDYDVRCALCQGVRVVPVPLDPKVAEVIATAEMNRHASRAEMLAEMRMGA